MPPAPAWRLCASTPLTAVPWSVARPRPWISTSSSSGTDAMADTLQLTITVDDKGTPVLKTFAGSVQQATDAMSKNGSAAAQQLTAHTESLTASLGNGVKSFLSFTASLAGFTLGAA